MTRQRFFTAAAMVELVTAVLAGSAGGIATVLNSPAPHGLTSAQPRQASQVRISVFAGAIAEKLGHSSCCLSPDTRAQRPHQGP
jgi:hypothetical protein